MVKYRFIGVKFTESDAKLVKSVAVARGENVSDFVRRSVRKELARLSYLSVEDRKALGLLIMRLSENMEMVGNLKNIKEEDGALILIFEVQKELEIPSNLDMEEKLHKMIGEKIAIFRLDDEYFIRQIPEVDRVRNG